LQNVGKTTEILRGIPLQIVKNLKKFDDILRGEPLGKYEEIH